MQVLCVSTGVTSNKNKIIKNDGKIKNLANFFGKTKLSDLIKIKDVRWLRNIIGSHMFNLIIYSFKYISMYACVYVYTHMHLDG